MTSKVNAGDVAVAVVAAAVVGVSFGLGVGFAARARPSSGRLSTARCRGSTSSITRSSTSKGCTRAARSVVVFGLLALPAAGSAQTAITLPAYRASDGGVLFDSPIRVAWDSLVPVDLQAPALDADSARRRRLFAQRGMFGTEVTFPVPLPAEVQARRYYLMDSTGVSEVRPTGLRGTVRLIWARAGPRIDARRTFGQVHASAPVPGSQGFVLVTTQPVTLEVDSSSYTSDALLAPRGEAYPHQGTMFWRIARQYVVRQTAPTRQQWTWVHWMSDTANVEGGCSHRFALFHWDPAPVMVASLSAGCDV